MTLARRMWLASAALALLVGAGHLRVELGVAPRGDHDDGDRAQATVSAELLEHFDPAQAGEHDVENDEVRPILAREREGLGAVAGFDEAVTGSEHGPDELAQARVVVADENRCAAVIGCRMLSWFVHRDWRCGGAVPCKSSHRSPTAEAGAGDVRSAARIPPSRC